jgi:hypothetical protein
MMQVASDDPVAPHGPFVEAVIPCSGTFTSMWPYSRADTLSSVTESNELGIHDGQEYHGVVTQSRGSLLVSMKAND